MKRRGGELSPAFQVLGERLHEAARREIAAEAPRRARRRPRRLAIVAFASLFAAAGVAGAGTLIDVGAPLEQRDYPPVATPGGSGRVALQVADPHGGLPWGVRTYRSHGGRDCVVAGRLRGSQLGFVRAGVFRPLAAGTRGPCRRLTQRSVLLAVMSAPEPQPRTLVYGRAGRGIDRLRVTVKGAATVVRPGMDGAFLRVHPRRVLPRDVDVTPVG